MITLDTYPAAYETTDIERFLKLVFPPEWGGVAARILESGATFGPKGPWAPRWSPIPPAVRGKGAPEYEREIKSVIFRAHDCLHQLWGLPIPRDFSEDERYYFKRNVMCGEVAVLVLTEFVLAKWLHGSRSSLVQVVIEERNAIPMLSRGLRGKSTMEIAARIDDVLHKQRRPKWVRDCAYATAFADDFVPMLEGDRMEVDRHWDLMVAANWRPEGIPDTRPAKHLDGLELTQWMIADFEHLLDTDPEPDRGLVEFNRRRRAEIVLPEGWGDPSFKPAALSSDLHGRRTCAPATPI